MKPSSPFASSKPKAPPRDRQTLARMLAKTWTPEQLALMDEIDLGRSYRPQAKVAGQRKVCIVGFHRGYWDGVPWRDDSWERWGFNGLYRDMPLAHFTRWFELHAPGKDLGQRGWIEPVEELVEVSERMPLYLTGKDQRIPRALPYPKAKVEALTPHGAYHAGSFDYLVAFAILEGFQEITVAGLDFNSGGEPLSARPCLEYWLGVAEGRGITVDVIAGDLFRIFHLVRSDLQYGFDGFTLVEDR